MGRSINALVLAAGFASVIALSGGLAHAGEVSPAPGHVQEGGGSFGDCRDGKGHRGGHFLKRLAKKLDLSEQQEAQIKASFKRRESTVKPLMANLRTEREQLRNLIHSANADEAAIRAQSARVAAVEADLAVLRAQGAKELNAILTPEQQAKFKALRGEWEQKMKKRHAHHHGPEGF